MMVGFMENIKSILKKNEYQIQTTFQYILFSSSIILHARLQVKNYVN